LRPIDGSLELIEFCVVKYGLERVAISTTANQWEVAPFMRHHGVPDLGFIATREQVGIEGLKPAPNLYILSKNYLGPHAISFAVEDSPRGVAAAKAAELFTFGITTTHTLNDLSNADSVVDSHREIISFLG
jgi:beta-phosphoglucomutase-like phosphatase (HAD superfamily)